MNSIKYKQITECAMCDVYICVCVLQGTSEALRRRGKQTNVCMYSVGKRACVEPLKNKIEILKTDVIMNIAFCQV